MFGARSTFCLQTSSFCAVVVLELDCESAITRRGQGVQIANPTPTGSESPRRTWSLENYIFGTSPRGFWAGLRSGSCVSTAISSNPDTQHSILCDE